MHVTIGCNETLFQVIMVYDEIFIAFRNRPGLDDLLHVEMGQDELFYCM